jgi:Predicted ATPase
MVRTAVEKVQEEEGENYPYSMEDLIDVLGRIQDDEVLLDEDGNKTETVEHAEKVQFKLERLKSYGIFGTTEINFEELVSPRQLTVLDLSGIPFKAQDLISELVLDRIYQARVRHSLGESGETYRYPIFTVVEEAHRLCPADTGKGMDARAKEKLSEIASEGRKFGAFLSLITQRPSKIDEDVLSQCNSMIIQRIVNRKDQQSIASASESMAHSMIDELPGLNVGDAIITGPAVNIPSVVHIRERKTEHGGDDIDISGNLEDARQDAEKEEKTTDRLGEEDSLDI